MTSDAGARHLPLSVPVYQILLSLSDRVLHGYAIIQDIQERTEGAVDLTASTLYGAVKRLLGDEFLEETGAPQGVDADDPRRRYYRITPRGMDVLRAETRRLRRALDEAAAKGLTAETSERAVP